MIFIDTSYWVALAIRSDALHQRAMAWSRRVDKPCLTTEYVLVEFTNRLSEPRLRPRAHSLLSAVARLPALQVLDASPGLFQAGLEMHRNRSDKGWSLTDCISFVVMADRKIVEALTHDEHFEQAGFVALLRRSPDSQT